MNVQDITGEVFGELTVLERDFEEESKHPSRGSTYWKCKCSCGNEKSILKGSLKSGRTTSCGCKRKKIAAQHMKTLSSNNYIDETGKRYGKLIVLYKTENNSATRQGVVWRCKCDCGNEKDVFGTDLRNGTTASCGCMGNSKGEWKIEQLLLENNLLYIKEYPQIISEKTLRFDFAILKENKLWYFIEFDGKQHYEPSNLFGGESYLKYTQEHDKLKNDFCSQNNIPLIRIPYTKYNSLTIEDLLLN